MYFASCVHDRTKRLRDFEKGPTDKTAKEYIDTININIGNGQTICGVLNLTHSNDLELWADNQLHVAHNWQKTIDDHFTPIESANVRSFMKDFLLNISEREFDKAVLTKDVIGNWVQNLSLVDHDDFKRALDIRKLQPVTTSQRQIFDCAEEVIYRLNYKKVAKKLALVVAIYMTIEQQNIAHRLHIVKLEFSFQNSMNYILPLQGALEEFENKIDSFTLSQLLELIERLLTLSVDLQKNLDDYKDFFSVTQQVNVTSMFESMKKLQDTLKNMKKDAEAKWYMYMDVHVESALESLRAIGDL